MRVLLADDEPEIVGLIEDTLSELGHEVATAGDGIAALETLVTSGPIDVLVTDVMMPRMRGDELARRARASRPALPIVVISGNLTPSLADELRAALRGRLAILAKPFTMGALVDEIDRVTGHGRARPALANAAAA
ncbi:MAG: response regulator [Acetobacteraceae bacterium]|nr:response regulator [Acetobacteraceae bacterium]